MPVKRGEVERGDTVLVRTTMAAVGGAAMHVRHRKAKVLDTNRNGVKIRFIDDGDVRIIHYRNLDHDVPDEVETPKRAEVKRDANLRVMPSLTYSLEDKLAQDEERARSATKDADRQLALAQIEALKAASAPPPAIEPETERDERDAEHDDVIEHADEVHTMPPAPHELAQAMHEVVVHAESRREPAPVPPPVAKSIDEMSADDVAREIVRLEEEERTLMEMLAPIEESLRRLKQRRKWLREENARGSRPRVKHRAPDGRDVLDRHVDAIVRRKVER